MPRPISPTRRLLSAANARAIAVRTSATPFPIETEDGVALETEDGRVIQTEEATA